MGLDSQSVRNPQLSAQVWALFLGKRRVFPPTGGFAAVPAGSEVSLFAEAGEHRSDSEFYPCAYSFQTLENMLASVKKGKKIDEEEIPPPVALGKGASSPQPSPASPLPAARPGRKF